MDDREFSSDTRRKRHNSESGASKHSDYVSFSHTGGFYSAPFSLVLSYTDSIDIRFTLDGSEPSEHSNLYTSPIYIEERTNEENTLSAFTDISHNYANAAPPADKVFKAAVIRAAPFPKGSPPGPVSTHTYFISEQSKDRYSLPVIAFSAHIDSFLNYEKGIYVLGKTWFDAGADDHSGGAPANYNRRGRDWERKMHMEMFDKDGNQIISQGIGVRLHGGWSRAFPQKSFRLYSRSDYGKGRFTHKIFPDLELDNFNRLILRNSGQDVTMTLFRDAYIQQTVKHMNIITQAWQPVILFINGEYWGIYNIRERYDKHFLETHYSADSNKIDLLTGNRYPKEGSNIHYRAMLEYLSKNDITLPAHYDHIKTMMDVDNFIDYYIAQIYARNTDWPHGNIDYWRYQTDYNPNAAVPELDGRWRWMMFDTDFAFGWQPEKWPSVRQNSWDNRRDFDRRSYTRNMMLRVTETGSIAWATWLFRRLMENSLFRTRFMNRFADMLNTAYLPERMISVLDSMKSLYAPEINEHIQRWNEVKPDVWQHFYRPFITYEEWEGEVSVMREFAEKRPAYQWNHLMEFDKKDTLCLTLNISGPRSGYLRINSINIRPETIGVSDDPYPWKGSYFKGIPVTITAVSNPGYRFAGWNEYPEHQSGVLALTPHAGSTITARFEAVQEHDPPAHRLADSEYLFTKWPADSPAGTYPANMIFVYMDHSEPGLNAAAAGKTTGGYNLESRTRITGMGGQGFAFINTSNEEGNPGYPGRRLGGAVLALDTRDCRDIEVRWTGGTVLPNSRIYNIRLEYRVGWEGDFKTVFDETGQPVEYQRDKTEGHRRILNPVMLPEDAENQDYVQLLWRYYYTGNRENSEDGSRSKLLVDNILVTVSTAASVEDKAAFPAPASFHLSQNYPNPFNQSTQLEYTVPIKSKITLTIYSLLGQLILEKSYEKTPGTYTFNWNGDDQHGRALESGVYILKMTGQNFISAKKMVLIR